MGRVVCGPHAFDGDSRRHAARHLKIIIRRLQASGARPFPLVGIAEPLPLGGADLRSLSCLDPYDGIRAGDVWELELIDTRARPLGRAGSGIIKRRHEARAADLFERWIIEIDALLLRVPRAL